MDDLPIVIDNGSYEIKFGVSNSRIPFRAINAIAKDKYNTVYLSNQIKGIKDISSVNFRRPYELGQLTSWELESAIWDYCFYNPEEFDGFQLEDTSKKHLVISETCLSLPEFSRNIDHIIFEEYNYGSIYKSPVAGFIPFADLTKDVISISGKADDDDDDNNAKFQEQLVTNDLNTYISSEEPSVTKTAEYKDFQLIIDSGFNCTWIIPVIKGIPYYKAIKKMDIGGRFLTGLLKETLSFRHYNVTDETILVNNIKEKCLFVAPKSYAESFKLKNKTAVEYVLPDFHTTFMGYIKDNSKTKLPDNAQLITLKDELFSVTETIFHPEISRILKPGIIETIIESLSMLPEVIRPLMVNNIVCIGGNFNLPNFSKRLTSELQRQLPTDWTTHVYIPKIDAELFGWKAMAQFSDTDSYRKARITREEYMEHGVEWCTKHRFGYQNWI
ncbi:hypothetical protein TBLA_0H01460 [Henningerozyma blattae CBS 6284]|uniref:Actin-like protein ARP6 n=1 Tax=Henningerozyma blattae (strain ATCC 34711 / CBS 6284 / DSM 70876 / NBRC 10599 / NRRL Y-10934 / UCD 77-7) TaxID=1071380 RepID=I2H7T1_HENB6|nr:hypothetical protein TBLA_0H01460 [Tetrapisispora blattae CBS 6284]CCH62433.1 hypothetical protein TBLA_0H01460 [Tetrapisispora blattae CBS 6284]